MVKLAFFFFFFYPFHLQIWPLQESLCHHLFDVVLFIFTEDLARSVGTLLCGWYSFFYSTVCGATTADYHLMTGM